MAYSYPSTWNSYSHSYRGSDKMIIQMDDYPRKLLKWLIEERGMDYASVSRKIGKNHAYIQQYISRGVPRYLPEGVRHELAALFGLQEENFKPKGKRLSVVFGKDFTKEELPEAPPAKVAKPERSAVFDFSGEDYAALPVYDARLAAGAGGESEDEVLHHVMFRMQWLKSVTTAPLDKLAVTEIDGDSMEPTLRSGDHGLIDSTQNMPSKKDGIYAIRTDDGLQIKRITTHPVTKMLTISSDNKEYRSFDEIPPDQIHIIGRLIWYGRRV